MNNMLTGPNNFIANNAKNSNFMTDFADFIGWGSARRQREFDKEMASTQYQRATQDMQAAGLNPGLMYGSGQGADVPGGQSASSGKAIGNALGIASIFSNTAKVMKAVHDIKTDKRLAENAMNISKRIGFK